MKAGVAVQLSVAAALVRPARDVTWVFYDNEEVEASRNGLGRMAGEHPELLQGSFAVLCEPTSARIEGGCQGTMLLQVELTGVAAHSARAWMGHNAIHGSSPGLPSQAHCDLGRRSCVPRSDRAERAARPPLPLLPVHRPAAALERPASQARPRQPAPPRAAGLRRCDRRSGPLTCAAAPSLQPQLW